MYIKAVHIENFRNFTTFDTDLEPFTLITGANNSGKSNLFAAFEKVLSLTSPRNARISQSDFNNATLPIVIEITFHQLTDHDIAAFHHPLGLINASTNTLKLRFEAKWDAEEQDVLSECYFVRDDLSENQRRANYTRHYREYVSHYFTSSFQSSERELSFSQRQSFGKIIRTFAGDYLKPIDVLNNHLSESVEQLKADVELTPDETLSETERSQIVSQCDAVIRFCSDRDILQLETETDFDKAIDDLSAITTDFSDMIEKFKTAYPDDVDLKEIFGLFDALLAQMGVLAQRISIRKDLSRWSTSLQATNSFRDANEKLASVFKQLLLDQELSFQMLPVGDEQLIGSVSAILGDFPLGDHGDGYKSIFNIGLGLTEVLAGEILNNRRSAITCLFIEEIEHNLHPHMQRHVISQLRGLQENWAENGRQLQVILTTHSPSCLKRVSPTELVQLRPDSRAIKWRHDQLEDLANTLTSRNSLSNLKQWSERLFGEFAEVLLSKVAIIVEGDTEQGFISALIDESSDTDYFGIALINASTGSKIQYIATLLSGLEIQFVCVADSGDNHELSMIPEEQLFSTNEKAFEKEIMSSKCYDEILKVIESYLPQSKIDNMLADIRQTFPNVYSMDNLIVEIPQMDENQEKVLTGRVLKWMKDCKGIEFGYLLYKGLSSTNIPQIYKDAVIGAKSIAKGLHNGA
jgi:predicted ATP-dependent endonuclease of OLD family